MTKIPSPAPSGSFEQARPILARLFGEMTDEAFSDLSIMLSWVHCQSGACIFRESEPGDAMYILIQGRLRVVEEANGRQKIIAEIGKGECVGEMSLLTGKPRNASIYAIRDCNLIRMSKSAFEKITRLRPEAGLNLSRLLIKRFSQKKTSATVEKHYQCDDDKVG